MHFTRETEQLIVNIALMGERMHIIDQQNIGLRQTVAERIPLTG
jgi:hypothetical protein